MDEFIPLSYNPVNPLLLEQVLRAYEGLDHSTIITDFEKQISALTGSPFVVALNSGTAAVHMAIKALNISEEDEVLTSTFTYVGSVNPILYQQASPVFIDSEMITWNMDPVLVEKALQERQKKAKAILVVHSYGMPADMNSLLSISRRFNIPIIEDAAAALGSTYQGKHVGTIGDVGILSFNNNKIVTTYGGGALLTSNESIYKKVKYWAGQSRENKPYYEHGEVGYSYRMGPLNAAAGLASLKDFSQRIESKRKIYDYYKNQLLSSECFQFDDEIKKTFTNRWLSTLLLTKGDMSHERLGLFLKEHNVETRPLWNPMHKQPAFERFHAYLNGNSDELFSKGICLPSSFTLSKYNQDRIVSLIRSLS